MAMETSYSNRRESVEPQGGATATPSLDPLRPLIAGARARGIADGLELAGVAAVLIDDRGIVLHAGAAARRMLGPDLALQYDHLVGRDGDSTGKIQKLISDSLGHGTLHGGPRDLEVAGRDGRRLILRARPVPGAAGDAMQLLKLLIIIEECVIS